MEAKESLDFGFPFNVSNADVLLDIPLAAMRPITNQIPASCEDWYTIGRWANVANANAGLTWVTLDAPLLQFDDPMAGLRDRGSNANAFKRGPGHLYSWVMNNRWGTNYRAYQEGLTEFRYVLRPFQKSSPADATRFATGFDQPLLVTEPAEKRASRCILPRLDSEDVVVSAAKPSDDGRALIFRLFGASGKERKISLHWPGRHPAHLFLSGTSEAPVSKTSDEITVPGYGLVTLRAEFE
jgi:alpha-mannosidase